MELGSEPSTPKLAIAGVASSEPTSIFVGATGTGTFGVGGAFGAGGVGEPSLAAVVVIVRGVVALIVAGAGDVSVVAGGAGFADVVVVAGEPTFTDQDGSDRHKAICNVLNSRMERFDEWSV